MPTDARGWHLDTVLTNMSLKYQNDDLIADLVCPPVSVKHKSDYYGVYGKEHFRVPRTLRAPRTESAQIDWAVSTAPYVCREYAISALIDDIERDNTDDWIALEQDTVELLTDVLLLDREVRVAALMTDTGTFANAEPATLWSVSATADPVANVLAAKEVMRAAIGREPNVMVLPKAVLAKLRLCTKVIDQIKYTAALGQVTNQILQALFGIDRVLLTGSLHMTSVEGDTEVLEDVWGETVGLYYIEPAMGRKQITAARTFRMRPFEVRRARIATAHSDWFETCVVEGHEVIAPGAGYLLTDVLSGS